MEQGEDAQEQMRSQQALRKCLKDDLDVRIIARTQVGGRQGPWMFMTSEQMRKAVHFRTIHMEGNKQLQEWVGTLPSTDETEQTWGFAFWHNLDDKMNTLPDACFAGLSSASKVLNVKLVSYQPLQVPPNVTLLNAEEVLPLSRVTYLLGLGVPIAHIADYVRLKAVLSFGRGGWIIDCDTLWFRKPPVLAYPWQHPHYGHQFASLRAAMCHRSRLADFQHWSVYFLQKQMDKLYLATPFFFPARSPLLKDIIKSLNPLFVEQHWQDKSDMSWVSGVSLTRHSTVNYCAIMDCVRELIRQHGLECAIHGPDAFAALNYFTWKKASVVEKPINDAGKKVLGQIDSVVIAINMYWSSSRDHAAHQQGSLASVHKRSLWAKLQERLASESDSTIAGCPGSKRQEETRAPAESKDQPEGEEDVVRKRPVCNQPSGASGAGNQPEGEEDVVRKRPACNRQHKSDGAGNSSAL